MHARDEGWVAGEDACERPRFVTSIGTMGIAGIASASPASSSSLDVLEEAAPAPVAGPSSLIPGTRQPKHEQACLSGEGLRTLWRRGRSVASVVTLVVICNIIQRQRYSMRFRNGGGRDIWNEMVGRGGGGGE